MLTPGLILDNYEAFDAKQLAAEKTKNIYPQIIFDHDVPFIFTHIFNDIIAHIKEAAARGSMGLNKSYAQLPWTTALYLKQALVDLDYRVKVSKIKDSILKRTIINFHITWDKAKQLPRKEKKS